MIEIDVSVMFKVDRKLRSLSFSIENSKTIGDVRKTILSKISSKREESLFHWWNDPRIESMPDGVILSTLHLFGNVIYVDVFVTKDRKSAIPVSVSNTNIEDKECNGNEKRSFLGENVGETSHHRVEGGGSSRLGDPVASMPAPRRVPGYQISVFHSLNEYSKRKRGGRRRIMFTYEEEYLVAAGVKQFGVGRWNDILHSGWSVFRHNLRSSTMIKDKYRTMLKQSPSYFENEENGT